jgi:collagenase-like PrtC family protease
MPVATVDGEPFVTVNGIQTLSYAVCNLIGELAALRRLGINRFRLSPQAVDMVTVGRIFRDVLDAREDVGAAQARLAELVTFAPFSNGYYHGRDGMAWCAPAESKGASGEAGIQP